MRPCRHCDWIIHFKMQKINSVVSGQNIITPKRQLYRKASLKLQCLASLLQLSVIDHSPGRKFCMRHTYQMKEYLRFSQYLYFSQNSQFWSYYVLTKHQRIIFKNLHSLFSFLGWYFNGIALCYTRFPSPQSWGSSHYFRAILL